MQPHIAGDDILDSKWKLTMYNNENDIFIQDSNPPESIDDGESLHMEMTGEGAFKLIADNALVTEVTGFDSKAIVDLVESANGDLYALVNENNIMYIYKRLFGTDSWDIKISNDSMYGYDLCETDLGILVGVSNLYTNNNSGLYLLSNGSLTNISIGEPIPHVQFIEYRSGTIYLYGNDYSHLYSFNLYSLENADTGLKTTVVNKTVFNNSLYIDQFILSSDGKTAIFKTITGKIRLYQNPSGLWFEEYSFDPEVIDDSDNFVSILTGEYSEGDFNIYLIIKEDFSSISIMENKYTHRLVINSVDLAGVTGETLLGVCFTEKNFNLLYSTGSGYVIKTGKVLFNSLYLDETATETYDPSGITIVQGNMRFLSTHYGDFYLGFGKGLSENKLYSFTHSFPSSETVSFDYRNNDIDGIWGFSFECDPVWTESDSIALGFSVNETTGDTQLINVPPTSLLQFLPLEEDSFSVGHFYDITKGKTIVKVTFSQLQKESYLHYDISLNSGGTISPELHNLTILKKIPIRLPRNGQEIIYLPIRGFVADPTVETISINNEPLMLEEDGSFSILHPIMTVESEKKITLDCINGVGDTAEISFVVQLFDSIQDLLNVTFTDGIGDPLTLNGSVIETISDTIQITADYYGLRGVICGYELYRIIGDDPLELDLVRKGMFEKNPDTDFDFTLLPPGSDNPGTGYESGALVNQPIILRPGRQQLVLFAENPGGSRSEYTISGDYPEIAYNLLPENQEIIFTNIDIEDMVVDPETGPVIVDEVEIDKQIELDVFEVADGNSYIYKRNYIITGEIRSEYNFEDLKIKSFNPEITFENGAAEMIIDVSRGYKFQFMISIILPETGTGGEYDLAVIPTAPFLEWMKCGIRIKVQKSFADTFIVPDFSPIDPSENPWSQEEIDDLKKSLRINIDRFVPENTRINLLVNFELPLSGTLFEVEKGSGLYKVLEDELEVELSGTKPGMDELTGIKLGVNRISWSLTLNNREISSSLSGREGMEDFIFNLEPLIEYNETIITFPVNLQEYYTASTLPDLVVNKDKRTECRISLNDKLIWVDSGSEEDYVLTWDNTAIKEGRNTVSVYYEEITGEEQTLKFAFLYDTVFPQVSIISYSFDSDYLFLDDLSAMTREANFDKAELFYGPDPQSLFPNAPVISIIEDDYYLLTWSGINEIVTPANPVRVKVTDRAGNETFSLEFNGLSSGDQPENKEPVFVSGLTFYDPVGLNHPSFPNEFGYTPSKPQHMKFYNSNLGLLNIPSGDDYTYESEGNLSIGPIVVDGNNLTLNAENGLGLRPGFDFRDGAEFSMGIEDFYNLNQFNFTHNETSTAITFIFWLRYEHESCYDVDQEYRTIFTMTGDEGNIISLKYKDDGDSEPGQEYLYLDYDDGETVELLIGGTGFPISKNDVDDWNLVLLSVDGLSNTIELSINDNAIGMNTLEEEDTAAILAGGAPYLFGEADAADNGFFSIAELFYVNAPITYSDLFDLEQEPGGGFTLPGVEYNKTYTFDSDTDREGEEHDSLRYFGSDYFTSLENADFTEEPGKGSLKASSNHVNRFKVAEDGVIFDDSTHPIPINLDVTSDVNSFTLTPDNSYYLGRYFFGDNDSTHGVLYNDYYTISGRILNDPDTEPVDARIIMRVNGVEQSMELKAGRFQYIYENDQGSVTDVIVYIDTNEKLILSNDMIMTEGNYILPLEGADEFDTSYASTLCNFQKEMSISFWYKPFNYNGAGYVNYNTVLFDSEYVKVGATTDDSGKAYYFTYIKTDESGMSYIPLVTEVPVLMGWQHLHVTFSAENDIAYFYINGKMAAKAEGITIPVFGSMAGTAPSGDNVFIGCDSLQQVFADGFIDELKISGIYALPAYEDRSPVSFSYTETPEPSLGFEALNGINYTDIENAEFILRSDNTGEVITNAPGTITGPSDHGLDAATLQSGPYMVFSDMLINGRRHALLYGFIKDDRPCFFLKSVTPFIISNVESDISFRLGFDDSYVFGTDAARYAGLKFKINYDSPEGRIETIRYVTQDFMNQVKTQWIYGSGLIHEWKNLVLDGDTITAIFPDVISKNIINWEITSFYFDAVFDEGAVSSDPEKTGTIADASISVEKISRRINISESESKDIEYKLEVTVGSGEGVFDGNLSDDLAIGYRVEGVDNEYTKSGILSLPASGETVIYYDDILPAFGTYTAVISLRYKGEPRDSEILTLNWEKVDTGISFANEKRLSIIEFALINIDSDDHASVYLEYDRMSLTDQVQYIISVISLDDNSYSESDITGVITDSGNGFMLIDNIPVPAGDFIIKIKLRSVGDGLDVNARIEGSNKTEAPKIVLTNSVPSLIGYNNVYFSWKGLINGKFDETILYRYAIDDIDFSSPSSERSLELFNLEEGRHLFRVKAVYLGEESSVERVSYSVDISVPVIDTSLISCEKVFDNDGLAVKARITGLEGSISETMLDVLLVNGSPVTVHEDGSFDTLEIPLTVDGIQNITFIAYDLMGNHTEEIISVQNNITELLFPDIRIPVKYAPAVLVGKLDENINAKCRIYAKDPLCEERGNGNYEGWKEAHINVDHTFFIEDIFIRPGSREREVHTIIQLDIVFESGKTFTRDIDIIANDITLPIEMNLSTHAVQGGSDVTQIDIDCLAKVTNISSWSIDYTGDGIYDEVQLVHNTAIAEHHSWTHTYSSLGLVKPRVRIITLDGEYFSVKDEIIIHEQIKEASHKLINLPIAMDVLSAVDKPHRVFVLAGQGTGKRIEIYDVGINEEYISDPVMTIQLSGMGIDNPQYIAAYDEKTLFIASNRYGSGSVHLIKANDYFNFQPILDARVPVNFEISDIDVDDTTLYISFASSNSIASVSLNEEGIPDPETIYFKVPGMETDQAENNLHISRGSEGLYISDYFNQRIILATESLEAVEYNGSFGNGEGEFIKPSVIETTEHRIFVYDEGRYDIQVFDDDFKVITTLSYDSAAGAGNYLESEFFQDMVDMGAIVKEENGLLYYYVLLLSRSVNKLAMLRLPQWEKLPVRARNNHIVFTKENEVFTAKPDGSDLRRIVSSDSIPFIEGTLDYPALAPDGRNLVFTSRKILYDGSGIVTGSDERPYAFDNLYVINAEKASGLSRIPLGGFESYEIERPVFNSNGDKVIFSAKPRNGKWQLFVYNLETGGISKLIPPEEGVTPYENLRFPCFSPNDRFVAFTTDYDGDEDIEVLDIENPNMRVIVTNNNCRDSYPVWNSLYPTEITNPDLEIESKIAMVSERNDHKGIWYVYVAHRGDANLEIVKQDGSSIGNEPDLAAIEITSGEEEGDYPAFVGDGESVVFEHYDGTQQTLRRYYFTDSETGTIPNLNGARRPAGMKNTIANFNAEPINGNEVKLTWTRYTEEDVNYYVWYIKNDEVEEFTEKKVTAQNGITIPDLEMGMEYLFKVLIVENGEKAAETRWERVNIPKVAARPSFEIDPVNPYLVHLQAWKSDPEDDWYFTWVIDNIDHAVQSNPTMHYEFATSGMKTIYLKAATQANQEPVTSEPLFINIVSDIHPVVEYYLADDASYIELNAKNSKGYRIDWANCVWKITGPGRDIPPAPATGSQAIFNLNGFLHKININLVLPRIPVNGQSATDTIETNLVVDLDFQDVKPVITYTSDDANPRLVHFSGQNSLGNIDWTRAQWKIFADGGIINQEQSVSSCVYLFPESGIESSYSVSLTIPRRNDNMTETASIVVNIDPAPMEPVIDYEILELKEGTNTVGTKILFSCGNSKGNSIDFNGARWTVPVAGSYNEQPTQIGPTAVYNLVNITDDTIIEVSLTLMRRNGTDVTTVTELIRLKEGEIPITECIVNIAEEPTTEGRALIFDVLGSKGPNIDYERTDWLFDGQYARKGPVARYDVPADSEARTIQWTCTLYLHGGNPVMKRGQVDLEEDVIEPFITKEDIDEDKPHIIKLSVLQTTGINIDYARTMWYIHDGNEGVVQKQGASIMHTFAIKDNAMGYPVIVEMYHKGSSKPYVGYRSVDILANELLPDIFWEASPDDETVIYFSAKNSTGSNIDWAQAKWTFGDSAESQYGPEVTHTYAYGSVEKEYKVTLTLLRRSANGTTETKTKYTTIVIGEDEVKPAINAKLYDNGYLVLSAEESQGRGLLIDRSLWLFEGEGDDESISIHNEGGTISTDSFNMEAGIEFKGGYTFLGPLDFPVISELFGLDIKASTGTSHSEQNVDYSDYINNNESYSSSNIHTGGVCRRYIKEYDAANGEWTQTKNVIVTLFVYRMNPDGSMEGRSITVNLNLNSVKMKTASGKGDVYFE